tara:strand:+ start:796 stop:2202 length:1407 start_codon:yes stop_codon:yes gene_type:complete
MATSIRNFLDFMDATGPVYLTGPDVLINEAVKRNYLFGDLIRDKNQAIQGGKEIKDVLHLDDSSTFQYYQPNETFTYSNPQVMSDITANWRFSMDHMTFTDAEIELNVGGGLTREATKTVYKDLKRSKEQRMVTSMVNGMEEQLFKPTQGTAFNDMETATGKTPYSIPAFITENCIQTSIDGGGAAGLRGGMPICSDTAEGGAAGSTNTTILGINPSTKNRWSNEVVFYDANSALGINSGAIGGSAASFNQQKKIQNNTSSGTPSADLALNAFAAINVYGFLNAFDEMFLRLQYRPPVSFEQYFENIVFNRQKILCSREGINLYKQALRSENDRLVTPTDAAYNSPAYSGIPLTYVAQLDSAKIFPKHATSNDPAGVHTIAEYDDAALDPNEGTTELATNVINPGARYYFINGDYLTPVLHSSRYMEKHPTMQHPNQPFTHVQITDSWYNVVANSRQRHGILAPMITA